MVENDKSVYCYNTGENLSLKKGEIMWILNYYSKFIYKILFFQTSSLNKNKN